MRQLSAILALALLWPPGCAEQVFDAGDGDIVTAVMAAADAQPPDDSADNTSDGSDDSAPGPASGTWYFSGQVASGDYQLYELGPGRAGDRWTVSASGLMSGPFVVVLFDANHNLLMRTYLTYSQPLVHVLRADTDDLYLGVMPPSGQAGGTYRLKATLKGGQPVPPPRPQVVWLNFGGASGVSVHGQEPISFAAFDGAAIDPDLYAGTTDEIKAAIVAAMREDYAGYNVQIISSDEAPQPAGAVSIVHFGGSSPGLLGLADSVDNYNADQTQAAVVYIESFAPYRTMRLTPEEMGVMIANVASHELGHLLGLYHTVNHSDLMDSTGSAWDLAGQQDFVGGALEPTVFATGYEDAPTLLLQTVGPDPQSAKSSATLKTHTGRFRAIRAVVEQDLAHTCGTCLDIDGP